MPLYSFICKDDHVHDYICGFDKVPSWRKCPKCGKRSGRLFEPPNLNVFKPYVTAHFDGNPVEVTTASQEDSLCKKHGVYRMLDSEEFNFSKSKRIREERKKAELEKIPWEKAIAMAEADHGQKLVTPDKPKKKKKQTA